MEKQPLAFRSVSNIFNTEADQAIGPLDKKEIRSRLIADLFFSDRLLVPGTSLLCNPVTSFMSRYDQPFLENLLKVKKVTPILTDEAPSFEELLNLLLDREATSLRLQRLGLTEEVATFLDTCLEDMDKIVISQVELNKSKTETSKAFLKSLEKMLPVTKPYYKRIVELFNRELDARDIVTGSWWYRLAKEQIRDLIAFDTELNEIGSMVFDFSYSEVVSRPLIGHSYGQNLASIGSFVQSFVPVCELHVAPGILDSRDIESLLFDKEILAKIDLNTFDLLDKGTDERRKLYFKAVNDLISQPSEDCLLEAKVRLDEYLLSLAKIIKSSDLMQYADESKKIKRIKSQLVLWKTIDKVIPLIAAGSPVAKTIIGPTNIYEIFIVLAVELITQPLLREGLSSKVKKVANQLAKEVERLGEVTPVTLQLNRKAKR